MVFKEIQGIVVENVTYWKVISELQWINEHKSCSLYIYKCIKNQGPSEVSEN